MAVVAGNVREGCGFLCINSHWRRCCAEAAQEERKLEAARRQKKDDEVAHKMRLLSEARQLVERELERRVENLERQVWCCSA